MTAPKKSIFHRFDPESGKMINATKKTFYQINEKNLKLDPLYAKR